MTSGTSPFFSSITMRMPSRSLSSRRSLMPVSFLSRTSCGDLLDQPRLVDLVGDLGDDDGLAPALELLDLHARAHHHAAAPRRVGVAGCPCARRCTPPVGKSGPLMCFIRSATVQSGLVDQLDARVDHLAQVVRRDVRRHADGDAAAPLTSRFGNAPAGPSAPSASRRSSARSRPCSSRCRAAAARRSATGGTRCIAWPPAGRRRPSRSCPGRRPAGSACEKSCAMRTSAS